MTRSAGDGAGPETRRTDYDRVAPTYDRRYERTDYDALAERLRETARSVPRGSVLEIGCGTGHWLEVVAGAGARPVGLDPSREMLARARARPVPLGLVRGRAENLPFPDGRFDAAICVNAFHHVAGKREALAEARRVLAPGARLAVVGLDPHEGSDRWCVYEYFEGTLDADRARYPAAAWIREEMRRAGFVDVRTEVAQHLPVDESARVALARDLLAKASTSQLAILTDEEYARGIRAIEAAARAADARGEELRLVADLRLWETTGCAP